MTYVVVDEFTPVKPVRVNVLGILLEQLYDLNIMKEVFHKSETDQYVDINDMSVLPENMQTIVKAMKALQRAARSLDDNLDACNRTDTFQIVYAQMLGDNKCGFLLDEPLYAMLKTMPADMLAYPGWTYIPTFQKLLDLGNPTRDEFLEMYPGRPEDILFSAPKNTKSERYDSI